MSFQSQLLGATTSVLNAANDKAYKDSVEQFKNKDPNEVQLDNDILDLKEKTLQSDLDYTKKDIDAIQETMRSYDEQGKEYDDIKSISGENIGDLFKKRIKQIDELSEIKKQRKKLNNPPEMSIDESIRKGYMQAKQLKSEDKGEEKEDDKSKDFVSDMFKQSTEYINAQAALEKQRLLRRRRNGNDKSN